MTRSDPERRPADDTSFSRGLHVLLSIVDRRAMRADALAAELDLPLSTIYRYLQTLRHLGLVAQHDGNYTVGHRLRPPGASLPHDVLVPIARPSLTELADKTRETAVLAVRVGGQALCLDQVESSHTIRIAFRIGQLLPLHAGAASKVLLAHAPTELVEEILAADLVTFTAATPSAAELRLELERIRARRSATSRGELVPDAVAIGVPVFQGESIVCSLTVAGPSSRCDAQWVRRTTTLLDESGTALSRALDHVDSPPSRA